MKQHKYLEGRPIQGSLWDVIVSCKISTQLWNEIWGKLGTKLWTRLLVAAKELM